MEYPSRRELLRATTTGLTVGVVGCGGPRGVVSPSPTEETQPGIDLPDQIGLQVVTEELQTPVGIAFVPESERRYIIDQSGLVYHHGTDGLTADPVLDISDKVTAGGEKGLLGIALHPDFSDSQRVYLRYSAPQRAGTPDGYSHTFVLSEFSSNAGDGVIQPDSERTILEIPQPQANHNAGDIVFGPDDFLYIAVGDGGAAGDQGNGHVDDWYGAVSGGNGQDVTENLLGSLLRIDIDQSTENSEYAIPSSNPLRDGDGLDEHYAWGLRNPWRMAFDGEDLYVGDVGQNRFEEVNLIERGGNYGWNVREATRCFRADSCPAQTPDSIRGGEPLLNPIIEYPNVRNHPAPVSGVSVIGGNIYRGEELPGLAGTYVFGDLSIDGRLFTAQPPSDDGLWSTATLPIAEPDGERLNQLLSISRGPDGELYLLGRGPDTGGVYRMESAS